MRVIVYTLLMTPPPSPLAPFIYLSHLSFLVFLCSISPPDLFAVVCSAIKDGDLAKLIGWDKEWASIQTSAAACPKLDLSEEQLER